MLNNVWFGHLVKILFWDGQGLVLYAKLVQRGHFVWPTTNTAMCH